MVAKHLIQFFIVALSFLPILECDCDPLASSITLPDISKMTLEEKVGQLLMVHFRGEIANEDAKILIQNVKVGGFIYYNWANALTSTEQVQKLSQSLQQLSQSTHLAIPLLIAVDQEGGRVARLKEGFTVVPSNQAISDTHNPYLAEKYAAIIGQELLSVGINMNLAPVVDVNNNPNNPVIGDRSFGASPQIVIEFGAKALEGYRKVGILTTLKHFPGHGDVEVDSHLDLPLVGKSLEELERLELRPFVELAPAADAIMTAHLLVPALDAEHCSTLSKNTLSYLRHTIGFHGVIISDSLVMSGVLKKCQSVDEAAIQALEAGCDILLLGGMQLTGDHQNLELTVSDIQRIHKSIIGAIQTGRISQERLHEAVMHVFRLKNSLP